MSAAEDPGAALSSGAPVCRLCRVQKKPTSPQGSSASKKHGYSSGTVNVRPGTGGRTASSLIAFTPPIAHLPTPSNAGDLTLPPPIPHRGPFHQEATSLSKFLQLPKPTEKIPSAQLIHVSFWDGQHRGPQTHQLPFHGEQAATLLRGHSCKTYCTQCSPPRQGLRTTPSSPTRTIPSAQPRGRI